MGHLTPRQATVLIYQGDDLEQLAELRRRRDVTRRVAQKRLDDALATAQVAARGARREGDELSDSAEREAQAEYDAAVKPSDDAYEEFVAQAAERAFEIKLRHIGKLRFKELREKHPPRMVPNPLYDAEDAPDEPEEVIHEADAHPFFLNTETFPWALLSFIDEDDSTIRTITQPDFKDRGAVMSFLEDELAEGDFGGLWIKAWSLNRARGADPKATSYSTDPPTSPTT